jgi:hypothetical protein
MPAPTACIVSSLITLHSYASKSCSHSCAGNLCGLCRFAGDAVHPKNKFASRAAPAAPAASMPVPSQRRRHFEVATIMCHPRRRARPALPWEREKLHIRLSLRAVRARLPAR